MTGTAVFPDLERMYEASRLKLMFASLECFFSYTFPQL